MSLGVLVVTGSLLTGCVAPRAGGTDAGGKPLPAPVREASILAPTAEPEPVLVENEKRIEEELELASASEPQSAVESEARLPVSDLKNERIVIAPTEVPAELELPEVEDAALSDAEGFDSEEVDGVVQSVLPAEELEVSADQTKSESDVTTYLLDEAENSFQRENYEKARGQSERALTLEPTAARAYLILAKVELAEGRPERAAEMARQGLASSKDSNEMFKQLNQILGQVAEMPSPATIEGSDSAPAQEVVVPEVDVPESSVPDSKTPTPQTPSPI